jgi:hypothetical protein
MRTLPIIPVVLRSASAITKKFLKAVSIQVKGFLKAAGVRIFNVIQFPAAFRNPVHIAFMQLSETLL